MKCSSVCFAVLIAQGAGNTMAAGSCLSLDSAAADIDEHIVLVCSLSDNERLLYCENGNSISKILFQRLAFYGDDSAALYVLYTCNRSLAAACSVSEIYNFFLFNCFLGHLHSP